ncbi:MAG TPA: hypothetical protein VK636_08310 [Gemmatimonadaceae bacterium]|nr:hypothetical protein [Gemmatimonadaceae bacterium]
MLASRVRGALSLSAALAIVACGSGAEPGGQGTAPSAVAIVSGNGQTGLVGAPLTLPLAVRVTSSGTAVSGVTVNFTVASGAATVNPSSAPTDVTGQAKTQVTLGSSPGNVTITAAVAGTNLTATFLATAGTTTITLACSGGTPVTPNVGGVLPGVAGSGVCLGGGTAGADYTVVAFHANADALATATISVASRGATPLSTASVAPSFDMTSGTGVLQSRANSLRATFDAQLRETSRRTLTPMIPGARASLRQRAASAIVPGNPAIGSLFLLNANGTVGQACTPSINVTARVAAVSNLAIVLADTANPAGGFTDAEYAAFGATFDTLVSPLDVANFGQPTDVDNNGKILILFTKEVNKLTPRGSGGVIGGFFHERDLFPKTTTGGLDGCAGSNFAEMYYSLVPDPASPGRFGDTRAKADVQNLTPSTLVHEFQHLINAGRRLYVNNADAFEDTWLNEGLSHVAEELLYFHASQLVPRANINGTVIRTSQASVNNFNNLQGDNFGRFEIFIGKPSVTSPFADNDSLETRGATWHLLRYLADHRGSSDGDTWQMLVNTPLVGHANLAHVFGADYLTQIRDWTTALFADDLTGQADVRFSAPSWNMRNIFPQLVNGSGQPLGIYPLKMTPLGDATPANVSIVGGAAAYLRFSVPANTSASIDWSSSGLPVSPLVQFTVVRSR